MSSRVFLVALFCVSAVYRVQAGCTPSEIVLNPGNVIATTVDRFYQPGDILYRNCTEPSARQRVGWCPDPHDTTPKIQVNLPQLSEIHSIEFQKLWTDCVNPTIGVDAYVEKFALNYVMAGDAEGSLITYSENLTALTAASFGNVQRLDEPLVTSTIRIIPTKHNTYPCFRFRVVGCPASSLCAADWCMNGGSCAGQDYCVCRPGFFGYRCNETATDVELQDYSFLEIVNNTVDTPAALFDVIGDVTLSTSRKRDHHHNHHHSCHFQSHHGHSCYLHYNHHHSSYHSGHHSSHHSSHCMSHLSSHHGGFTTSLNIKFGHNHHGHTHIYSNGGNLQGHTGASLSYHNGQLHFHVSTGHHHWHASHHCNLLGNIWHNIATSWHPHTGAQIILNNKVVGTSTTPTPNSCQNGCTKTVDLHFGHGHTSLSVNVNLNFSLKDILMYGLNKLGLNNLGIQGPYTAAPPTTPKPTTTKAATTPKPTTTTQKPTTAKPTTTTKKPTTTLVSATAKKMTTPPTTTIKLGPLCYSYAHEAKIGGSGKTKRCKSGEICTIYHDKNGYTAECLTKQLCDAGKRLAGQGQCWECCDSYLCNDHCAATQTQQCQDKPTCATMLSTGYDVCKNTKMALDICRKHCNVC